VDESPARGWPWTRSGPVPASALASGYQYPEDHPPEPDLVGASGDADSEDAAGLPSADAVNDLLQGITTMVTGLVADFENVLPHVVGALERNAAFDELSARLRKAEAAAAVGLNWTLIDGVHRLLSETRSLDLDARVKEMFVQELGGLLHSAGVDEFGIRGEAFDPGRHEAVSAAGEGDRFVVVTVHATGLERAGAVLKRAKVTVRRSALDAERLRQGASDNGG
jgi:hypothetical protein